jgi:hypothetical protein
VVQNHKCTGTVKDYRTGILQLNYGVGAFSKWTFLVHIRTPGLTRHKKFKVGFISPISHPTNNKQQRWFFRSLNPLSVTASQNLRKIYTQLQLSSKEDKKIPVKAITKLFAQSKDDRKLVERALDQSGLPCGKGDEISRSSFTFDQFKVLAKN